MTRLVTRREVLEQLGKMGEKRISALKLHCRDYERYMVDKYEYRVQRAHPEPPRTRNGA